MRQLTKFLPWKRSIIISSIILSVLIILSFYGLYTNKFYFFKIDNYILPIFSIIHFIFLYVLWFKIKEEEISDSPMRNIEYSLYILIIVYLFKLFDVAYTISGYTEFDDHQIPGTFFPMGVFMIILYIALIGLTILNFMYRKIHVGPYNVDILNEQIDSWE